MSDNQPNTEKPDTAKPAKPARSPEEEAELAKNLARWSASFAHELDVADLQVDIDAVLALAGVAAHAVLRPAAPLTTYLVGYAAGRAAALGEISGEQATARAARSPPLSRAASRGERGVGRAARRMGPGPRARLRRRGRVAAGLPSPVCGGRARSRRSGDRPLRCSALRVVGDGWLGRSRVGSLGAADGVGGFGS